MSQKVTIGKNFCKVLAVQLMLVALLSIAVLPAHSAAAANGGQNQNNNAPQAGGNGNNGGGNPNPSSVPTAGHQSDISAGGLPDPAVDNSKLGTILTIVFGIIGAFAVLNISLSGFKYITAAGNAQKTSEAKSGIAYSLVGLMIAISAEAIVAFLVKGV